MNTNETPTITTPSRQLTQAEAIAKFRNARAIEKLRNAKPLPASPRKEAKLRSAITKLKETPVVLYPMNMKWEVE